MLFYSYSQEAPPAGEVVVITISFKEAFEKRDRIERDIRDTATMRAVDKEFARLLIEEILIEERSELSRLVELWPQWARNLSTELGFTFFPIILSA